MANLISYETRLTGGEGTRYVDGTGSPSEVDGLRNYVVFPREDTTITSITGEDKDGNAVDVLDQFGLTSGITLTKGEAYYVDMDTVITAIDVLTGSVRLN